MNKKIVKLLFGLMVLIVFSGVSNFSAVAYDEVKVVLNGTQLNFDVPPQIIDGRTMVPFRKIFEELGTTVHWLNEDAYQGEQKILATKGTKGIWIQIGNPELHIVQDILSSNNEKDVRIILDVSPMIMDGITLVPIRAVAEGLEMAVDWDEKTQTVTINDKKDNGAEEITQNTKLNYCYITDVYNDEKDNGEIVAQLLRWDGSLEEYKLAKVVNNYTVGASQKTFSGDGSDIDDFEEFFLGPIETGLRYVDFNGNLHDGSDTKYPPASGRRGKLVKFETNVDGEICGIEFATVSSRAVNNSAFTQYTNSGNKDYCVGAYEFDGIVNRLITSGVLNNSNGSYQYRGTVGVNTGEGKNAYVDDTLIFHIYVTGENTYNYSSCIDVNRSEVMTERSLLDGNVYPAVQIFDVDNTGVAKAVVVYADYIPHICFGGLAVIDSVSEVKNNKETVAKISFLQDGEKKVALTTIDVKKIALSLNKGAGAQFTFNSRGEIDGIIVLYEIANAGKINETPNIISDLIPEFNQGDKNIVYQYVADSSASRKFRIIVGPVGKFEKLKLTVSPWLCADNTTQAGIDAWKAELKEFRIRGYVNVYIYDNSKNDADKLTVGDIDDIIGENSDWNDINIGAQLKKGDPIPAPALAARDHVILREYDDVVTDVIIVKAYPYNLKK